MKRYEGKRVGGTTVVHSIKKHLWFLETANALLEGDDYTEAEQSPMLNLNTAGDLPHHLARIPLQ